MTKKHKKVSTHPQIQSQRSNKKFILLITLVATLVTLVPIVFYFLLFWWSGEFDAFLDY